MGPSVLTQEVSCDHVTVVGQHCCQQNVNGEEVNTAGLLDNELKGEEVNAADHAITLNCSVTPTDHFTRENFTPATISLLSCVRGNRHIGKSKVTPRRA